MSRRSKGQKTRGKKGKGTISHQSTSHSIMEKQPATYDPASATSPEIYLSTRVEDQISWYGKRSSQLKRRYHWFKGSTIAIGGLIPLCIAISDLFGDWLKYLAGLFGALISILEGISGMLKDKETFLAYRAANQALIREKMQYQSKSGKYAAGGNAFPIFVESCESIMAGENTQWVSAQIKDKNEEKAA